MSVRTGLGYDAHRFATERALVLGGVTIPFDRGLLGHSDADVLLHAIADALLGAVGAGDIGLHFPPDDPRWRDLASRVILTHAAALVRDAGFEIAAIDSTLIAELPKIAPYVPAMRQAIADALGVPPDRVSVKATTNEGMGFIGREEGIAALAVATLAATSTDQAG